MTPKPVVQGLLLCDYFIVEEGTGKASPIGCFSSIGADRFPSVVLPFSVVCFLSSGRGDGIIRLVISSLDTLEEIYVQERVISFPDRFSEVRYHFRVRMFFSRPWLVPSVSLVGWRIAFRKANGCFRKEGDGMKKRRPQPLPSDPTITFSDAIVIHDYGPGDTTVRPMRPGTPIDPDRDELLKRWKQSQAKKKRKKK